jgi:hypothetical protein
LLTKKWNQRLVKYTARESRSGALWRVALPERCAVCGTSQNISPAVIKRFVRCFDGPVGSVVNGVALAAALLAAAIFFRLATLYWLAAWAVVAAGALLWLKSSREELNLSLVHCPSHSLSVARPAVAVFENDLFVFLPGSGGAEAVRLDLAGARRDSRRYNLDEGAASAAEAAASAARALGAAPSSGVSLPRRDILPPIRLDGD